MEGRHEDLVIAAHYEECSSLPDNDGGECDCWLSSVRAALAYDGSET